jgi:hypothetical protein
MAHRLAQEVDVEYDPHFAESTVRTIYERIRHLALRPRIFRISDSMVPRSALIARMSDAVTLRTAMVCVASKSACIKSRF